MEKTNPAELKQGDVIAVHNGRKFVRKTVRDTEQTDEGTVVRMTDGTWELFYPGSTAQKFA